MNIGKVWLDALEVGERLRKVDDTKVSALAESMEAIGLQQPISVWFDEEEAMHLVAGLHRVRAAEKLGWEQIDAVTVEMDETDRELWEIDENLMRADLSEVDRSVHLKRRKELWEARQKNTGATCTENRERGRPKEFASETAEKTGIAKSTVTRSVSRAEAIPTSVMAMIRGTSLDRGVYLDALKKLPKEEMAEKVRADLEANHRATVAANQIKPQTPSRVVVSDDKGDPDMADVAHRLASKYTASQLQEIVDHLTEIIKARCAA